jgi:Domain of unknown function (DUF1833)
MPRDLSANALKEIFSQQSSDPFLFLFTFTHPDYPGQFFRFVNNLVDITSRGDVYSAMAIKITLPVEDGNSIPTVMLEMDNVGLEILSEMRKVTSPFTVLVELILASDPSYIEMSVPDMLLTKLTYDASRLTGTLTSDNFLNQKLPSGIYSPNFFPGIFK